MQMPVHGQVIRFTRVPAGSYCSPGIAYRVDRPGDKGDFRFARPDESSATYDRPWAVKGAVWEVA